MPSPDHCTIKKASSVHAVCVGCDGKPANKRKCLRVEKCPLGKSPEERAK